MTKILLSERDDLWDYAQSILNDIPLNGWNIPQNGIRFFSPAVCVVLDRSGKFQAELCIFPEGEIPHHEHPDVDSIEIQITGKLHLFMDGKNIMHGREGKDLERFQKVGIRIPANVDHNVKIMEGGVAFLSVQRWNNNVQPSHVGLNWKGKVYSESQI